MNNNILGRFYFHSAEESNNVTGQDFHALSIDNGVVTGLCDLTPFSYRLNEIKFLKVELCHARQNNTPD